METLDGFVEFLVVAILFVGVVELIQMMGARSSLGWRRTSVAAMDPPDRSGFLRFRRSGRYGWFAFFLVAASICAYSARYWYDPWQTALYVLGAVFPLAGLRQLYIGMNVSGRGVTIARLLSRHVFRLSDLDAIDIDPKWRLHMGDTRPVLVFRWKQGDRTRSVKIDQLDEDHRQVGRKSSPSERRRSRSRSLRAAPSSISRTIQ